MHVLLADLFQNEETSFGHENDLAHFALGASFQEILIIRKVIWPPNICQQHVLPKCGVTYMQTPSSLCTKLCWQMFLLLANNPSPDFTVEFCSSAWFEYWIVLLSLFQPLFCVITFTELLPLASLSNESLTSSFLTCKNQNCIAETGRVFWIHHSVF